MCALQAAPEGSWLNIGASIIRTGFWGACGQMSEASTLTMPCASFEKLAAFEQSILTNRRNDFINATYH